MKGEDHPRRVLLRYVSTFLDVVVLELNESPGKPMLKISCPIVIGKLDPGQEFFLVGHRSWKRQAIEKAVIVSYDNLPSDDLPFVMFHSEKFGPGSSGSPGLLIERDRIIFTSILIGAFLDENNAPLKHFGIKTASLYSELSKKNPKLCRSLFYDCINTLRGVNTLHFTTRTEPKPFGKGMMERHNEPAMRFSF